jgi:hypothetical protein
MENQAAWFLAMGEGLKIGPAEIPHPGEGEIVIEVG